LRTTRREHGFRFGVGSRTCYNSFFTQERAFCIGRPLMHSKRCSVCLWSVCLCLASLHQQLCHRLAMAKVVAVRLRACILGRLRNSPQRSLWSWMLPTLLRLWSKRYPRQLRVPTPLVVSGSCVAAGATQAANSQHCCFEALLLRPACFLPSRTNVHDPHPTSTHP